MCVTVCMYEYITHISLKTLEKHTKLLTMIIFRG